MTDPEAFEDGGLAKEPREVACDPLPVQVVIHTVRLYTIQLILLSCQSR